MSFVTPPARSGRSWYLLLLAAVYVLFAVVLGGLSATYWFAHNGVAANAAELPYDQFSRKLDNGQIYKDGKHPLDLLIEEGNRTQTLTGFYSDLIPAAAHLDRLRPFHTTISLDYDKSLKEQLKAKDLTADIRNRSHPLATTLLSFLPLLIFLFIAASVSGLVIWVVVKVVLWVSSPRRRPNPAPPR